MVKTKTKWACIECGSMQPKWLGQCPQCKNWNVFHEEVEVVEKSLRFGIVDRKKNKAIRINDVTVFEEKRVCSNISELDRLLGGGVVMGSMVLLGGEPGIGKSTLTLQFANELAKNGLKVLYISGEESVEQILMRAKRLNISHENLFLFSETDLDKIKLEIESIKPEIVIIDSIQIVYKKDIPSLPGSITQVREAATDLMHISKRQNIATFIIGHVTKSGELAGPKVLEHLVDTVLYFEGDRQHDYRILRAQKNRFGPTDEIAVFKMEEAGLVEVVNPSEIFLEDRNLKMIGSVVIATVEGSRPILVEAQALVTETVFSTPMRKSAGLDPNRLALLLAVLEKRLCYPLHRSDVFVSIAGGMKIVEPGIDLGILISIASSFLNKKIDSNTCLLGEVGLGGDIRRISRIELRLKEAYRMGFTRCIIPKKNHAGLSMRSFSKDFQIIGVDFVEEAIDLFLN